MFEKAEILIVDDMPEHIAFAGTILRNEGFRVLGATSAKAALKMMEKSKPHLVLLDIKMEGMDGLELCRHFKSDEETKEIPVIFMTSESDPAMIKKGFELGCCDYVVKPFRVAELVSRIMANVRRISGGTDIYKDGTLTVDFKNKSITHADKQISVSPTEFHVLEILINNKGLIVRRDTFFQKMWDRYGTFVEDNTLTVTVSRLKTKLGNRDDGRTYIETIRGIGYRWKNN